jgi:hypothetical protein
MMFKREWGPWGNIIINAVLGNEKVWNHCAIKNDVFWDVAPCRCYMSRRFGRTNRLHLQGRKIHDRGTRVSRWLQPHKIYRVPHSRRLHSS